MQAEHLENHISRTGSKDQTHQDEVCMMNNYDTYFSIRRVYCLYRVSTLGQVEKDDIPMQKQRCREFAAA